MERIRRGHSSGLIDQSQHRACFAFFDAIAGLRHAAPTCGTNSRLYDWEDVTLLPITLLGDRAHYHVTFVTRLKAVPLVILARVSRHVWHPKNPGRYPGVCVRVIATFA